MKEKLKHYTKEIILFFIVMTIFMNIVSLYKSSDLNKKPLNMKNITLLDNSNYQPPHAKPILIHFWATWCPTCKIETSNIQTLSEHYEVLTIAVKSGSNDEINQWLKESGYDFNVVNDYNGFIASDFKLSVFPSVFSYTSLLPRDYQQQQHNPEHFLVRRHQLQ